MVLLHKPADVGSIGKLLYDAAADNHQGRRLHDAEFFCQVRTLLRVDNLVILSLQELLGRYTVGAGFGGKEIQAG